MRFILSLNFKDLRKAIANLEKFSGVLSFLGELNCFIKGVDKLILSIDAKATKDLLNQGGVSSLKAALVSRVRGHVFNVIQTDEDPLGSCKGKAQKTYGMADGLRRRTFFKFLGILNKIVSQVGSMPEHLSPDIEKMRETVNIAEAETPGNRDDDA